MVEPLNHNTETTSRVRLKSFVKRLDQSLMDVLPRIDRPVRYAWSEPDRSVTIGCGTCTSLSRDGQRTDRQLRSRGEELLNEISVVSEAEEVPERARPRFFGGVAFPGPSTASSVWTPFGERRFLLPELQLVADGSTTWVTLTGRYESVSEQREEVERLQSRISAGNGTPSGTISLPDGSSVAQHPTDRDTWRSMVRDVLDAIDRGDLKKVVLARERILQFDEPFSTDDLLRMLLKAPSESFRFLMRPRDGTVFAGLSPECLVRKQGTEVRAESIGGTIESGRSEDERRAFAEELIENRKDQREHSYVIQSIRDRLAPFAEDLSEGDQTVRVLSSVQHLCTPIHVRLREDEHVLTLVDALHPTSAVGGIPSDRALEEIHRLEPFERGWYGGPIGWFDRHGDGCFAVGIRSGLMEEDTVHLYAGAGIVDGSEPDREWEEVEWKFETMTSLITPTGSSADTS